MTYTLKDKNGKFHFINKLFFVLPVLLVLIAIIMTVIINSYANRYKNACGELKNMLLNGGESYTTDWSSAFEFAFENLVWADEDLVYIRTENLHWYTEDYITFKVYYDNPIDPVLYYAKLAEYRAKIRDILDDMPENLSDEEKIKWVHDYMCANYTYGGSHYATDMIDDGVGVCSAYTQMFGSFMYALGIECHTAIVKNSSINHSWNIVRVNGEWKHIDVTWDDADDIVRYDYYLISSSELLHNDSDRYNWYDASGAAFDENGKLFEILKIFWIVTAAVSFICIVKIAYVLLRIKLCKPSECSEGYSGIADESDFENLRKTLEMLPPEEAEKLKDFLESEKDGNT